MMKKSSQHVVPTPRGGWAVRSAGATRSTKTFSSQQEAVNFAKALAKSQGAVLYVHRKDGSIRERSSYGNDRFPPRVKW